ncbi:hypothetical protein TMUPMC115_1048 [Tetragenococcus muriaticus PMC-11-5]|uniref:Uncharacterized protein n=2 Tax=Tetragenococcus muriaticus TaxID=64642 RepID=A0A091C3X0_9ENTE|nr:hypothetical protein TMU3MR103_0941 [Tetragenococcus muriaticus 3MR10-3]KFN92236.1 hypothetical protein TMUPMC115_1048 [Tetragenococcus muriaticus PMC-11-5]GMA46611.1 hypothetical protein GCM10025854_08610 [Tetragenococcus muriaticus]
MVTGVSGSGKSSLVFDTFEIEGGRLTFSGTVEELEKAQHTVTAPLFDSREN